MEVSSITCLTSASETPCTSWLLCKDHFYCAVWEKWSWLLHSLSNLVWQKATGTFANSVCTGCSLQQGPSCLTGERVLFCGVLASITWDLMCFASGCNPDLHWCPLFFSPLRIECIYLPKMCSWLGSSSECFLWNEGRPKWQRRK